MPMPYFDKDPQKTKETEKLVLTLFLGALALVFFPVFIIYFLLKDGKHIPQKLLVIVSLLALSSLATDYWNQSELKTKTSPAESTSSKEDAASDDEIWNTEFYTNTFQRAIDDATRASELTQTAVTSTDWSFVASYWDSAVGWMELIPEPNDNYQIAQQKISEYQVNLDYALSNVERMQEVEAK